MQDFINPKSMMTPGIAGSTMMFIVNGIVFAFPEIQPRIIALILSFLIGSIVFASRSDLSTAIWTKSVYWVVNSLIIFVVGFGTAHFAASNTNAAQNQIESSLIFPSLISSAYAQDNKEESATSQQSSTKQSELKAQLELERKRNAELTEQLSKQRTDDKTSEKNASKAVVKSNSDRKQQESLFFKQW
jgi:hypothetical protein